MTNKKYIDEEIVKALECCISTATDEACVGCPFNKQKLCDKDRRALGRYALDLINRQKSEIDRQNTFIENQNELISKLALICKNARIEAYKEFAKEMNKEISRTYDNNSGVLREHLEKHKEKPNFEFVAAIQGRMNTLRGLDDFIDNLLEEMVGKKIL